MSDPNVPPARQPFHLGLDLPPAQGARLVRPVVKSVVTFGRRSVLNLLREYSKTGRRLRGVGIVVGSVVDPASIAHPHIRAHAEEGRLFREVIERAARSLKLTPLVLVEKRLRAEAGEALRRMAALGAGVPGPWRSEQKAAALAAWMALPQRR